jgi:hypothetical protein
MKGEYNDMVIDSDDYTDELLITIYNKDVNATVEEKIATINNRISDRLMNTELKRDLMNYIWHNQEELNLYHGPNNR